MCCGISLMVTVWANSPAASPCVCPLPLCTGTRPWRFGSAKFVCPLPPYVVPRSENSGWFWLIGNSWPLHCAQPLGAKLYDISLISARNGSDMLLPGSLGAGVSDESATRRRVVGHRGPGGGVDQLALHEAHHGGA